jgi:hypothetical protein
MSARVGDRIVVAGHYTGGPNRDCTVVVVLGADGRPPYLVRWEDTGHEAVFFPGVNAIVRRSADPFCRAER